MVKCLAQALVEAEIEPPTFGLVDNRLNLLCHSVSIQNADDLLKNTVAQNTSPTITKNMICCACARVYVRV